MMFRANPQHFCFALGALFFLARYTAIMGHNRVAFRAYALSTASHRVFAILFVHFVSPVDQCSMACLLRSFAIPLPCQSSVTTIANSTRSLLAPGAYRVAG
jgi:hypothetical protein